MIFMLIFSASITVHAKSNSASIINEDIANLLKKQFNEHEMEILLTEEYYKTATGMTKEVVANKPILKIHPYIYWELSDESANTILDLREKTEGRYIIFGEKIEQIGVGLENGEMKIGMVTPFEVIPTYLTDIQNMDVNTEICQTACTVEEIVCFNGLSSRDGVAVYLITDKGTFIKYYRNKTSNAVEFTEEDFKVYAKNYYEYITAYENNYNEKGEPINGGTVDFTDFIKTKYPYVPNNNIASDANNSTAPNDSNGRSKAFWIGISVGLITTFAAGMCVFIYFNKKRHTKPNI